MTPLRTLPAAAAAALTVAALAATPALAHVRLSSTSPGKGKTARTSIRTVTVSFSGSFTTGTLSVTGPGGAVVGSGFQDPRRASRLLAELQGGLKPGTYRASWRILDDDGHRQGGSFSFRLRR